MDISVIMSGLPGKMATLVAETIAKRESLEDKNYMGLYGTGLTGENQPDKCSILDREIYLHPPQEHDRTLETIRRITDPTILKIIVDYTHPDAVNKNAELYCEHNLPFVMGTTGGDRKALEQVVLDSGNIAVISPNMAKSIVLFQAMMEYAAQTFPGALQDFTLGIAESHQATKKDTSGTAKAMVSYFNKLGISFKVEDIKMFREPEVQRAMGVPEQYLSGHGWHSYDVLSEDKTVFLGFKHNVNGRQVYADGTIDAIRFLARKVAHPEHGFRIKEGKVYSMIDVLKGN